MAGPRASGKSFYIAVMRRQLESLFNHEGLSMGYATEASREVFEQRYETPVYIERGLIAPDQRAQLNPVERQPMIFTAGTDVAGRPHRLVIRDVAGEDLEAGLREPYLFDFFADADTILFMFDPLKVDKVRQMLVGLVPQPKALGDDPQVVLDNLLVKLQALRAPSQRLSLGLVLSKFDVLQELSRVEGTDLASTMRNPGAAYLRDPSMRSLAYDHQDARLLHVEVRSLLIRLGAAALVRRIESAAPHTRFFAVSALGQPALGDSINPHGISPFRCVDPVKWALAKAGVVPTVS